MPLPGPADASLVRTELLNDLGVVARPHPEPSSPWSPPTHAVTGCPLLRLCGPRWGGGPRQGAKACGGEQVGVLAVAGAGEIDDRPADVLRRHGRAGASQEGRR